MRVIFAGTPDFAARHLQALIEHSDIELVAVYTQPDRPAGRGKKLQPSAVKSLALTHALPVEQPASLKTAETHAQLAAYRADVMVVVAYGLLLPQAVLDIPKFGCLNVHGSLLPKWRGAAPIQRAIWAGDHQSGITIMQMDAGLDTGPILSTAAITLDADETSASLYQRLADLGPPALMTVLNDLADYRAKQQPQLDDQATYAAKLSKAEAQCDWRKSALALEREVRAFNPWPISWFNLNGNALKVWQAEVVNGDTRATPGTIIKADKHGLVVQTSDAALRITQLQLPGKRAQQFADIYNARADWFAVGQTLEDTPHE